VREHVEHLRQRRAQELLLPDLRQAQRKVLVTFEKQLPDLGRS
jgi:hypothetical protein